MNKNENCSNDPILDWILKPDTTEETNKPISPELLSYLLTHDVNTDLVRQQPQLQCPPQTQPQLQQRASPETASSSHLTSSPSEEDDEPTDAQLKLMPSKERRQLRNKISARNFRNRRKEYMATLEAELEQCKTENSQLKHEVKWVRSMMDKLQAENDKLRLNLVLCKEGIEPTQKSNDALNITPTASPDMSSMVNTNSNSNNWELMYPTNNPTMVNHNIYLAHASMPNWDMSCIFEKNSKHVPSEETDLIRKYPLLAPALMSIVLSHTMTMTTEQIIANSTLYDPTWATKPDDKSLLSNSIIWQNLLQSHQVNNTDEPEQKEQEIEEIQSKCPISWIQKRFCNFIISYVVVRYPHLDYKCRTYLPICEKYRT